MTPDDETRPRDPADAPAPPLPLGSSLAWEQAPPPEAVLEPSPEGPTSIPGAVEIVGQGLDLNLAAAGPIRRATLYAGAMHLLLLGPLALIVALVIARHGPEIIDLIVNAAVRPIGVDFGPAPGAFFIGVFAVLAVSVDLQNMAVALIDGQASGRGLALRAALAIARRSFWRLVFASIMSGLIVAIVTAIIQAILGDRSAGAELDLARNTIISLVVGMPFAYIGTAVVIGGAGPVAAIGSSVRLARRRWRLAFVIGVVNTATGLLAAFAFGAGGDILIRLATILGVGAESGAGPLQIAGLVLIVSFAIAAIGSLTMTIAALSVAPQVVAYRGLGGARAGSQTLDAAAAPDPSVPPAIADRAAPLITIGMRVAIALLALFTLASVFRFA